MTYRELSFACSVCHTLLEERSPGQLGCGGCRRVLVGPETLAELLHDAAPDIRRRKGVLAFPQPANVPRRVCPVCSEEMLPGILFEATVDQCARDGIWIAQDDLPRMLEVARERFEQRRKDRRPRT